MDAGFEMGQEHELAIGQADGDVVAPVGLQIDVARGIVGHVIHHPPHLSISGGQHRQVVAIKILHVPPLLGKTGALLDYDEVQRMAPGATVGVLPTVHTPMHGRASGTLSGLPTRTSAICVRPWVRSGRSGFSSQHCFLSSDTVD